MCVLSVASRGGWTRSCDSLHDCAVVWILYGAACTIVVTSCAYAQAGLSNWFCPSVVVVCHKKFEKNFITRNLEAIITSNQEVTIQIPNKSTCAYLTVTKALLVSACQAFSYSTSVWSAIFLQSRVRNSVTPTASLKYTNMQYNAFNTEPALQLLHQARQV